MTDAALPLANLLALSQGRSARSSQTHDRIVAVAARLFERKGYAATSMADIAAAAKLTKATVYYHFASKESMYTSICTQHAARSMQYVDELSASGLTPAEKLVELIWYLVAGTIHEQTTRLLFDTHARVSHESQEVIRTSQHRYVDAITRELTAAQAGGDAFLDDPKIMALAAFESIGRTRRWFDPHGRVPSDEAGRTIVRMFLRALLKAPACELFDERLQASGEEFFPSRFNLINIGDGQPERG